MKVICFSRSLTLGGAERQLVALARTLSRMNHEVIVLTYRGGDFYTDALDGIRHVNLDIRPSLAGIKDLAEFFRSEKPDAVLSFMTGPGLKAALVKLFFYHDLKFTTSDRNVSLHFYPHDHIKYALLRQAALWAPNSYAQADFLRRHFPSMNSRIIPAVNVCDTDYFCPEVNSTVPITGGHRVKRVVTMARVDARKNLLGWIDAVAELSRRRDDFVVEWIGLDRENRFYRRCVRRIRKNGLEGRFLISPKSKDVLKQYRGADIFCLPSFYEGTPNVLCEALSCAVPAICSNVSDNALYVREGESGFLFDPHSPKSMAAALDAMLDKTPEERRMMGAKGREIICSSLSEDRFSATYEKILDILR